MKKKILLLPLVLMILLISNGHLKTSTNDWSGVPSDKIKKMRVIISNSRVDKRVIEQQEKENKELKKQKSCAILGFIGSAVLNLILGLALLF